MSYSLDNLPPELSAKPLDQKEAFVKAYVNAVQQGRTDGEAYVSGIGAVNILKTKQRLENKKNLSVKQNDLTVNKDNKQVPSHLLNLLNDVKTSNDLKQVNKVTGNNNTSTSFNPFDTSKTFTEVKETKFLLQPYLRKTELDSTVDRNVIAANFNNKDQLVIAFDTGEQITTDPIQINVNSTSHHVAVMGGGNSGSSSGGAPSGNLVYEAYELSGFTTTVTKLQHQMSFINSFYILKDNGNEVDAEVNINRLTQDITISGVIPLDQFTLYITGIKE